MNLNDFDNVQPEGLQEQPVNTLKQDLDANITNVMQQEQNKIPQVRAERIINFMKSLLAPIGYLTALVLAFVFVFIIPGSGFEQTTLPVITSIVGYFGLTNWRSNFDNFETWFKSKTIVGALIVVVPVLGIVIVALIGVSLPAWLMTLLGTLVTLGGGTSIIGVFDAYTKKSTPSK